MTLTSVVNGNPQQFKIWHVSKGKITQDKFNPGDDSPDYGKTIYFVVWLPKNNRTFSLPSKSKSIVIATPLVRMEEKPLKITQRCLAK